MLDALGVHAQHKSDADFSEHCAHCNGTGKACLKCDNEVKQSNKESLAVFNYVLHGGCEKWSTAQPNTAVLQGLVLDQQFTSGVCNTLH